MARIVKDAGERRTELLETALRLFANAGYGDTSVQDITDAVGVAKGTFYHYFTSKEALLESLAAWQAGELADQVLAAADRLDPDPIARMRLVIGLVAHWGIRDTRELTLEYVHELYRSDNLALRTRFIDCYLERVRPSLATLIEQGLATGALDVGDPDATTDILLAMWRGIGDHLAELLLASDGRPEAVGVVADHVRATEVAMERVLGMMPGSLRLYDHAELQESLSHLAQHATPTATSEGGAPR